MALVGKILAQLQRETGDHRPDPILALQWLQDRYHSILTRSQYNFLITEATFNTVAEVTDGTVELTNGSATVTESTSNANGWTSALEDRYFRVAGDSEFYPVSTYTDANPDTLTLSRVYEGSTASESSYKVFQRIYSLASDVDRVISMARIETSAPIEQVSQADLDQAVPHRPLLGNPDVWAPAGTSGDIFQVELYPIPDEAHGILYRYFRTVPALTDADSSTVAEVSIGLLKAGWLADYWNWRSAHDDAPQNAIVLADRNEGQFERRLQELLLKEGQKIPPKPIQISNRLVRHRVRRVEKFRRQVELESSES